MNLELGVGWWVVLLALWILVLIKVLWSFDLDLTFLTLVWQFIFSFTLILKQGNPGHAFWKPSFLLWLLQWWENWATCLGFLVPSNWLVEVVLVSVRGWSSIAWQLTLLQTADSRPSVQWLHTGWHLATGFCVSYKWSELNPSEYPCTVFMYMNSVVQFCNTHYLLFDKSILYIHL